MAAGPPGSAGVLAGSLKAPAFGRIYAGGDAGAPRNGQRYLTVLIATFD